MEKLLEKIGEKNFPKATILFCALGDIAILGYLYHKYSDYDGFNASFVEAMKIVKQINPNSVDLPENLMKEMFTLWINSLVMAITLGILFHTVIYIFHYFKKKHAGIYIKMMAWIAGIGVFFMGVGFIIDGNMPLALIFLVQSFLYFIVAKGMSYFKPTKPKTVER